MVQSTQHQVLITIALNQRYINHCLSLLSSILENAAFPSKIIFYIFTQQEEAVDTHMIINLVSKYKAVVNFVEIIPQKYRDLSQIEYKTIDAYSRIFAPKILHDLGYDKIIYLDTDLIVRSDIIKLWEIDLGDATIGAIRDDYYEKGEGFGPLFNSGVMVINTERWTHRNIEEEVVQEIRRGQVGKISLADQDDLNRVLAKDWKIMNPRWNVMAGDLMSGKVVYKDADIIHFNGNKFNKPDYRWNEHPGKSEYFHYLRIGRRALLPIIHIPPWLVRVVRRYFSV